MPFHLGNGSVVIEVIFSKNFWDDCNCSMASSQSATKLGSEIGPSVVEFILEQWIGISMLWDIHNKYPDLWVISDASGSWGCRAIWQNEWCQLPWDAHFKYEDIAMKGLVPVVVAAVVWGHNWPWILREPYEHARLCQAWWLKILIIHSHDYIWICSAEPLVQARCVWFCCCLCIACSCVSEALLLALRTFVSLFRH